MVEASSEGFGRRRYARLNVTPDSITARIDAEPSCAVKNISLGGVFAVSQVRYPVDTLVQVKLTRGERRLQCTGRVAHVQRDGVGLEFLRPSQAFRESLGALFDELLADGARFERRREHRVPVTETIVWETEGRRQESPLCDLSIGGALIGVASPTAPPPPPVGATIRIFLPDYIPSVEEQPPPTPGLCSTEAEVLRHSAEGFAVSFVRPRAAFNMALAHLLSAALVARRRGPQDDPTDGE